MHTSRSTFYVIIDLLVFTVKFQDTLSLVDSLGEPFAGGAYIKDSSNVAGKSRLVLYSKDDLPLCVAVQDAAKINKAYNIYGLKPLKASDTAQVKEGDVDFYPWFRIRDIDDSHLDFRSMQVWNGNNYQPCVRIVPNKRQPGKPIGDLLPPKKGDNTVVSSDDPNAVFACMSKKSTMFSERRWDLCIAPGADVMAMIMLGAIMDDMVGWFA